MEHRGLDFRKVRIVCHHCGWCRNIAHWGCADGKRALILVSKSSDPSHVLHARIVEVPEERPLEEVLREHPGYLDLGDESKRKGSAMMSEFRKLLDIQACPRCKSVGEMELEVMWTVEHVRY
jgi:hypothetical protein